MKRTYRKEQARLFTEACSDRAGEMASDKSRFRLIINEVFTVTVVMPWHRLHRAVVAAPSLGASKVRLDGAWTNLGEWNVSLSMTGGVTGYALKVPCNTNQSEIL